MVFVREKKVTSKTGKVYSYYQQVENRRDPVDGKTRQRVVANLGKFPSLEAARQYVAASKSGSVDDN